MKFYRLYSGDDGQSHFQELDSSRSSEFFNATRSAKGILFRNDFAPHIVNWHRAPRRRWVITLSGTVAIELGDGTCMTLGRAMSFSLKMSRLKATKPRLTIGFALTWTFREPLAARKSLPNPVHLKTPRCAGVDAD
jgi:hypothetical protein